MERRDWYNMSGIGILTKEEEVIYQAFKAAVPCIINSNGARVEMDVYIFKAILERYNK